MLFVLWPKINKCGCLVCIAPSTTLFVGNLSFDTTQDSLSEVFGSASSVRLATDRDTGKPRG